jgi:hypothetical protein
MHVVSAATGVLGGLARAVLAEMPMPIADENDGFYDLMGQVGCHEAIMVASTKREPMRGWACTAGRSAAIVSNLYGAKATLCMHRGFPGDLAGLTTASPVLPLRQRRVAGVQPGKETFGCGPYRGCGAPAVIRFTQGC